MKCKFIVLIFAALTLSSCFCTKGIKAGVNFSSFSGENTEDLSSRTGFHVGGYGRFCIDEDGNLAIQPEILFSTQGANYDDGFDEGSFNLNYFNVPVLAQLKLSDEFYVEAGPQFGFLLSAKDKYDSGEEDIKDDVNSFDFSGNVGLGYQFDSGLNLNARYNMGFSEVPDINNLNWKNGVFQVSIAFSF
ncbi:PorT family protein [Sabulilitoribacter multivorans]|uniref:PorT family protein n=1 Tax=Flaviramulus multivorans TaxID=1304750 RepID=A0ABS9IJW6_9FLAO|nr:porin family protein [Flaviramulus multivorans]MCF7560881.1 PorT family protein [Flaviramulus multivorans]